MSKPETGSPMNTKMLLTGGDRPLCDACFKKQSDLMIRRIEVKDGTVEIEGSVATEILLSFVGSALAILNGVDGGVRAENYVEMQCAAKELPGEIFTMIVQRPGGKTPHQLREQAEKERDELKLGLTDKNIADIREGTAKMLASLEGTAEDSRKLLHTFDLITAQLVEARGDTERLNWLEVNLEGVANIGGEWPFRVQGPRDRVLGKTLREAVDAAQKLFARAVSEQEKSS